METPLWFWLGFLAFIAVLLTLDLGVLHRREREITVREALIKSLGYFLLAMAFAAGVFAFRGPQSGFEFLTGYLIEWSLSIDNIFVFVLIFGYFAVPPRYQHRVLFWGILGALVLRGTMIFVGAQLFEAFHWIVYVFGAFLIFTSVKMLVLADAKPDLENNVIVRTMRHRIRLTAEYHGERFFTRQNGLLYATPLFMVLVLIEFTDVIFALDSIPAIFAITQDPFIVYTSNVFAILGLRSLYFAIGGIVHRFHYLKYGLSLVLGLIGVKMIVNGIAGGKLIPTEVALLATATLIGGSIALSWLRPPAESPDELPTGWVPGSPDSGSSDGPEAPR